MVTEEDISKGLFEIPETLQNIVNGCNSRKLPRDCTWNCSAVGSSCQVTYVEVTGEEHEHSKVFGCQNILLA